MASFRADVELNAGGRSRWIQTEVFFRSRVEAECYAQSLKDVFQAIGDYQVTSTGKPATHLYREDALVRL